MPTNTTKLIQFTEGEMIGEKAYVTYEDGDYLRATPVNGDPLRSIDLSYARGGFKELPPAVKLSEEEKTILTHTLTGGKRGGRVYRNHFYTGPGSDDMPIIEQLVTKGLMIPGAAPWGDGGDRYYHCTAAGAAAVGLQLLPKKGKW